MPVLIKENLSDLGIDNDLVQAVSTRVENGQFKDAISTAFIFLSDFIRQKSGLTGDGVQLIGSALSGQAPVIRLSSLQTVAQLDEQKGLEQILRGLYMGIRNPRSHENIEDTEEFCIRMLIIIDTVLNFLKREVPNFDVTGFANRVFEPYFVASNEYADSLVGQIPVDQNVTVFTEIFNRREESTSDKTRFLFYALYNQLGEDELKTVTQRIGNALRTESDSSKIREIFQIIRPDLWRFLQEDVQLRIENMIIADCRLGKLDAFLGGLQAGALGTWGAYFGKYFVNKTELRDTLINLLHNSWYTQNYVGNYYLNVLPNIVEEDSVDKFADAIAYAAVTNDAKILQYKFKQVCHNYPQNWKRALATAFQTRNTNQKPYVDEVLPLLTD